MIAGQFWGDLLRKVFGLTIVRPRLGSTRNLVRENFEKKHPESFLSPNGDYEIISLNFFVSDSEILTTSGKLRANPWQI